MKKRILAILLTTAMLSGLVAGCGGSGGAGTDKEAKGSGDKETVLTFMSVGGANETAYTNVITQVAEQFNKENEYNAKIKLEWYENEQYKTKLATLMTQNDVADIFFTWEAGFMKSYVDSGKIYSLSEAFEADPEWKERFKNGAFDAVTFDDNIYAVPMGQAVVPFYYNKKLFEEHGVKAPETWEEFMDAIATFKKAGIVPISMACQDAWVPGVFMLELSGGVGGKELFNDIVSGKTTWDDPRYVETGKVFQELVAAGAFPESFLGLAYDEGRNLLCTGKAAMYPMGTWETPSVIEGLGGQENVGVFLMPAKNPEYNGVHIASIEKLYAISENCKNKEAALAFLKMLSDPAVQEKYVVDCGALPATKVEIDKSKIDSVTAQIMELQGDVTEALTSMDRQFGANVGGEFNNISLAIAGGKDPLEEFTALKDYAAQEAEQ